ncbi:hypothetical protein HPT27_16320 [Permianibacter sp. IMCC34836]|uniref:hypothetical protein n=1 Tax=Permianibacter fluminis TaxID=2738515 RepID=UPI0015520C72|nr:hypothetical protein [Permianibacter fluminis]NQD38590.1 hypothetical protein [Permianibacter fluminis]
MLAAIIGVAVGVLTIVFARVIRGQHWVYAIGLLTLPSLYASFALYAGAPAIGVTEMLYGIPYVVAGLVFATVSIRHSAVVVGALWIAHGLYDLVHDRLITNAGVPDGYPVFCFTVDVIVGAYLLWLSRRITDANLRLA